VLGGKHERGRRAGSPDLLAAVGFGAACTVLGERLAAMPRIARLRAELEAGLLALGAVRNAEVGPRVATVSSVSLRGAAGEALVAALDLDGLCAASGAACSSGLSEPSPVLLAMYPSEAWRAGSALRLSLGPETSSAEVAAALAVLGRVVPRARPGVPNTPA
jgi:cysteine desulfurase